MSKLNTIFSIQSESKNDQDMLNYIDTYINNLNIKDLTYEKDSYGNRYVTVGKATDYPCVVAHTDTVHSFISDYIVCKMGDILYAFSEKNKKQVGIGGDDKNGIYIALKLLSEIKNLPLKLVFFRDEEIGRLGSKFSAIHHKEWYNDCRYIIQCDRKGHDEVITKSGGLTMVSKDFEDAIKPLMEKYGYHTASGICTDIDMLLDNGINKCAINVACGYYKPHTDLETVSISKLDNAFNFVKSIVHTITDTYNNIAKPVYIYTPTFRNCFHPKNNINISKKTPFIKNNDGTFTYTGMEAIHIMENSIRYVYLPHDLIMYDITNNRPVTDLNRVKRLFKELKYVDKKSNNAFVYSIKLGYWLLLNDADFDTTIHSYIKK